MDQNKPIPVIYDYDRFGDFFKDYCDEYRTRHRWFSYRRLAERVGLKSHTHLIRVARNAKIPSDELVVSIGQVLKIPREQVSYARYMTRLQATDNKSESRDLKEKLESLKGTVAKSG